MEGLMELIAGPDVHRILEETADKIFELIN